jgi:hypothetical protein
MVTPSYRSFGAALVLTMASQSPKLQQDVPEIDKLQEMVIQNIEKSAARVISDRQPGDQVGIESSLEAAVDILKEVKRKSRIRRLV